MHKINKSFLAESTSTRSSNNHFFLCLSAINTFSVFPPKPPTASCGTMVCIDNEKSKKRRLGTHDTSASEPLVCENVRRALYNTTNRHTKKQCAAGYSCERACFLREWCTYAEPTVGICVVGFDALEPRVFRFAHTRAPQRNRQSSTNTNNTRFCTQHAHTHGRFDASRLRAHTGRGLDFTSVFAYHLKSF